MSSGYVLQPVPRIWTRKKVLDQYGTVYEDPSEIDIDYREDEATVIPQGNTRSKHGVDRAETPEGGYATDIGTMPKREMERYLQYLKKMRAIFENEELGVKNRIGKIANISGYNDIKNKLNEEYDYPHCLFVKPLTEVKGIGYKTARSLFDAGFESVDSLREAEVEDLTAVEGIGQKTAERILKEFRERPYMPKKE